MSNLSHSLVELLLLGGVAIEVAQAIADLGDTVRGLPRFDLGGISSSKAITLLTFRSEVVECHHR
ncbi:MAG: hypothetical protein V7L22_24055 [Nostoc sp.]|uniref:hypothetical protein n=1 Tax=Nostoc sp. TaxID=1180 RepID=UPI002FF5A182